MDNLAKVLEDDEKFMNLLKIIQSFELKDCWLCAGTIRNYIWNVLSGKEGSSDAHFSDVDVIFFDRKLSYEQTLALEARVKRLYPEYRWEIKNQYYMHIHSPNTERYTSSRDAVSKFTEKCTAIAVRLNSNHNLELYAPYGVEDLVNFKVTPTPYYASDAERSLVYNNRVKKKAWRKFWPQLVVELI